MGYTAGALLECVPILQKILSDTTLLVQACKLYLECDFIIAAMRALANFTYSVTMPYLNFVGKSDQNAEGIPCGMDTYCNEGHCSIFSTHQHLLEQMSHAAAWPMV